MFYKTQKTKIEQHKPTKNRGELRSSDKVSSSSATNDTRCVSVNLYLY
jgi:hypothetical protein